MNKERLLKLADFLDTLDKDKFDFTSVVEEFDEGKGCGSVCCAIGWTPMVFPELVGWARWGVSVYSLEDTEIDHNYPEVSVKLFDIPRRDAVALFTPNCTHSLNEYYECDGFCDVTSSGEPSEVATQIRKYVDLITNIA